MCRIDPARLKTYLRFGSGAVIVLAVVTSTMMLAGGVTTFKIKYSDYEEDGGPGVSALRPFINCYDADEHNGGRARH
jgi:hypothetical protein